MRAGRVQDLFADIAPRYDLINDLQSFGLHRAWKRRLARLAGLKPGSSALDVCCGTGDIAFELSSSGATVIGVDFSNPMLRAAKARAGLRNVTFVQGDAQHLPFSDGVFDAVTVGYGLRNLASWHRGLDEMWRVVKPGGCALVLDFGKPPNEQWRRIFFWYLRVAVPIFGRLFCRNAPAYAYIMESLAPYPAQSGVATRMHELGSRDVTVINILGGAMSINMAVKQGE